MNRKTLLVTLSCVAVVIVTVFSFTLASCSKDEGANDEDTITGKWYPATTYDDSTLPSCERTSYYEFSDYKMDSTKRIINYHFSCTHDTMIEEEGDNGETVTVQQPLPPYTVENGYYTIKDSTLTVKLMNNSTTFYTILKINKQVTVLLNRNLI